VAYFNPPELELSTSLLYQHGHDEIHAAVTTLFSCHYDSHFKINNTSLVFSKSSLHPDAALYQRMTGTAPPSTAFFTSNIREQPIGCKSQYLFWLSNCNKILKLALKF
jgi:hypothetical protein